MSRAFCIKCGAPAPNKPVNGFCYCTAHLKRQRYLARRAAKREERERVKDVLFEGVMRGLTTWSR